MDNKELKKRILLNDDTHIEYLIEALNEDPNAPYHMLDYKALPGYLNELIEKDGSVIVGVISAIERYLNK